MRNFFEFATKELSQDAFLRWFIENDYQGSGRKLISKLTGVDYKDIRIIQTWAQSEHIDICVDFKVKDEPHILIIEDKVNSDEHSDQLVRYMKVVDKWNNWNNRHTNRPSHFIFYKPRVLKESEKKIIGSKNIEGKPYRWEVFDLIQINEFFQQYTQSDNLIIQQYAEYIEELNKQSINNKLPTEHKILAWKSFFEKTVAPLFDHTNLKASVSETFYGYSYLKLTPNNCDEKKTPYLEIRSRDCLDKTLNARILLYGVELSTDEINKYQDSIKKFGSYFHSENNSKQIASTHKRKAQAIKIKNQDEFISKIKEFAKEYLSIVKENNS